MALPNRFGRRNVGNFGSMASRSSSGSQMNTRLGTGPKTGPHVAAATSSQSPAGLQDSTLNSRLSRGGFLRSAGLAAGAVAAAGMGFGGFARAQTVGVINVPSDYPTIQAAVDAASPYDAILIAPGTYVEGKYLYVGDGNGDIVYENGSYTYVGYPFGSYTYYPLTIDKPLTLKPASSKPTIRPFAYYVPNPTISISSSNVTLDSLIIETTIHEAILAMFVSNCNFTNNAFLADNVTNTVALIGVDNIVVSNNLLSGTTPGLLFLFWGINNQVKNNNSQNANVKWIDCAIVSSSNNLISGNKFGKMSQYGVEPLYLGSMFDPSTPTNDNLVQDNDFRRCNDYGFVMGWEINSGCIYLDVGSSRNKILGSIGGSQWLGPQYLPPGTDWCNQVMDLGGLVPPDNNTVNLHKLCNNPHSAQVVAAAKLKNANKKIEQAARIQELCSFSGGTWDPVQMKCTRK